MTILWNASPGLASPDHLSPESVVGTIAGDNTIFAAIDSKDNVGAVLKLFTEAIS